MIRFYHKTHHAKEVLDMSDYEIMSLVLQVLILLVSIVTVTGSVIFSILSTKKDYPIDQDK